VSASETTDIKEAYLRAFRLILEDAPGENWAESFEKAVREAVDAVVALGPAAPTQILRDYRLLKEMGSLIGYVNETARAVVSQRVQLTPDIKEKLENADRRLGELNIVIKSECHYLLEHLESWKPALRLNRPGWTRKLLGDSFTDCAFILGKRRIMSLELSHHYKDAQTRTKRATTLVVWVSRRPNDATRQRGSG